MGYTHYWDQNTDFNNLQWHNLCNFVRAGVNVLNSGQQNVICNGLGEFWSFPTVTETEISFNGRGSKACETFWLERLKPEPQEYQFKDERYSGLPAKDVPTFNCCKTRKQPYDTMVMATLLYAAEVDNGKQVLSLSTDGDHNDWLAGVELYNNIVENIKITCPPSFERRRTKKELIMRVFGEAA
tara:strand:+ start:136 stop:687 length:552 start_codon:yes stop_codon:yes gene_type:complete